MRALEIKVFLNAAVESIEDFQSYAPCRTPVRPPEEKTKNLHDARCPIRNPVGEDTGVQFRASRKEDARFRIRYSLKADAPAVRGKQSEKAYRNQKWEKIGKKGWKQAGRGRQDNFPAASASSGTNDQNELFCDAVILCTGGLAGPSFGCTGDGYRLAGRYSHHIRKPLPALTQIVCDSPFLKYAAGVRCQAKISLYAAGSCGDTRHGDLPQAMDAHRDYAEDVHAAQGTSCLMPIGDARKKSPSTRAADTWASSGIRSLTKSPPTRAVDTQEGSMDRPACICAAEESGELQITDYGLSGIPVFQLSRTAAQLLDAGRTVYARIDFLPWMTDEMFARETAHRLQAETKDQMLSDYFLGLVNKKVLDLLLVSRGWQSEMKAKRLADAQLLEIMELLRCFELQVTGVRPFENAQVTCGGIPPGETDGNFGSVFRPGLYFAGEVLDIDGRCGGYNLQWADRKSTRLNSSH